MTDNGSLPPASLASVPTEIEAGAVAFLLDAQEVQSGHSRLQWAEGLIRQLPVTHDGRNSWLINYGESAEAVKRRENWNARAVSDGREPSCVFNPATKSTSRPATATGAPA